MCRTSTCASVATDLKAIYSASTEAEAEFNLELFAEKWDGFYPSISKSWRAHWTHVIPLFAFPEDIRKVISTTNAIESVNMTLRKVTRHHRIFPSDEAVYLAMRNIEKPVEDAGPQLETRTQSLCGGVRRTLSHMTRASSSEPGCIYFGQRRTRYEML
jgi:transposase-like protein